MPYDASRYYRYDELTAFLQELSDAYPQLCSLQSLARSYHGRDVWLMTVTNRDTGHADSKPAYWMDGNTHATELAGSAACLYALDLVTREYGKDPDITHLLDTRTLYVLPRITPDGAEYCLTTGDSVRSADRPYPFEDRHEGLRARDINGDGHILQMRLEDPHGQWKISPHDPRLMVKRLPDDRKGPFYRVYREGILEKTEDWRIEVKPTPFGMDFNRNYPYEWVPEPDQKGAGPYPMSEPETRAIIEFIVRHPNICGVQTYHTYSAAILRPYSMKADEHMHELDLEIYRALGARGTEITGYPCISVYHDFRRHNQEFIHGGFDDWCFHHRGIFAFTTEIWSIGKAAGLPVEDHIKFLERRSADEMLQIVKWHDEQGLEALVPWQPFDHPQLGPLEIGGWKTLFSWSNPPQKFLAEICEKLTRFSLAHAAASPRLVLETFEEERLTSAPALRKITLRIANEGYLPTSVSDHAAQRKLARRPQVQLEVAASVHLVMGKDYQEIDHLAGVANVVNAGWGDPTYFRGMTEENRTQVEWLVRGEGPITVTVTSERAGNLSASL
jgi:murein tripeptide amidase MpaA